MKEAQKKLNEKVKAPEFLAVSGSRLYGTNREGSDYDYRGFLIPPYEYLVGLAEFKCQEVEDEEDSKLYSLKEFFKMLSNGDPQCTELLFVPADKVVRTSDYYGELRANKHLFLSNVIYKRLMGFSNSEWRKAMAQKFEFEKLAPDHEQTRLNMLNYMRERGAAKVDLDEAVEMFDKFRKKDVVSSVSNLGAKRKADYDKYGFCVSSACHSIRLMGELAELMETGEITFPRENAETLKAIRLGEVSKEDCHKLYDEAREKAEKARDKSKLPDRPDNKKTSALYKSMLLRALKTDERFLNA